MSGIDVQRIKGIFAPIVTTFDEAGELDLKSMKANLDKWEKTRMAGYVVLGSNSEANYLSFDEKIRLVSYVVEENRGKKVVIAGTGVETTKDTIALTKAVAQEGAEAALVLPPFFFKASMNNTVLAAHYRAVADASPIPILIYNMPGNTGLNLDSNLVSELSFHQNIIGIKDSGGNLVQIGEIIAKSKPGFVVFAGSGSYILTTLVLGGHGTTAALANVLPDTLADIYDAFMAKDLERARKIQLKVMDINKAVTAKYGVPGLKAAMDMIGYVGGKPRLPMLPLPEKDRMDLERILRAAMN